MNSKSEKSCKKNYQSPNLVVYGGIRELTRTSTQGAYLDSDHMNQTGSIRSTTGDPF